MINFNKACTPFFKPNTGALFSKNFMLSLLLMMVVGSGWGQTTIFYYQNTTATIPSNWVLTNNVTTNVIDKSTYLLLDAGNPSDIITTPNYDLTGYSNVVLSYSIATFGTITSNPSFKLEVSTSSGVWSSTTYTSNTVSSSTQSALATISVTGQTFTSTTMFRFSNTLTSGTSIRLQSLKLTGTSQATSVTQTGTITAASIPGISCTIGTGAKRAIFMAAASTGSSAPANLTTYTANTVFGSGTQIGSTGWYCVFNNTGTPSVTVTGLTANTTYRVMVCEYDGAAAAEVYNTYASGTGNPANFTTILLGTNYYSKSTGNLETLSNWGTATDGTGTAPSNFTSNNQVFNIRNNATPTIGAAWTVSGTNSKIIVGNGTNGCNFTIPALYAVTGTVDVAAAATLTNTNTTNPTLGTLNATSTVVFNAAGPQTVPIATYGNLSISNTGSSTATAGGAIAVTTALTVLSGTTFDMSTFALTGAALTTSGTGTLKTQNTSATPIPTGRTWTMDVLYNSGNGQMVVAGTFANLNLTGGNRTLIASGTINISGTYTPGAGTLTVTNNTINFNGADGQTIPAATYNILTSTNNTRTLANGVIKIASTFTPGSSNYTIGTSTVEFNGSSAQTIPFLPVASGGNYYNLTYSGSSTGTLGGSITVAGNLSITAGILAVNNSTAYTLTVNGNTTLTAAKIDLNVSGSQQGIFNLLGNLTINGVNGIISTGGTLNGKLRFIGTTQSYNNSSTGTNVGYINYEIGDATNSTALTLNSSITLIDHAIYPGKLTIFNNGIFNAATYNISSSGTLGSIFIINSGGSLLTSNTGGILGTGTSSSNGTINNTNIPTKTFTAGANYTFNGISTTAFPTTSQQASFGNPANINVNANITLGRDISISGTLSLTSGTLTVGANTLTLSGSTINRDGTTYTGNIDASNASATVAFTNTSALTIPASTFTGTCKNITMNGAGGITLGSDLTIGGTLTFTSGKITTGANKVILTSAGSVSRTSGYVVGNLQKNVAVSATSRTFEIGDASNYSPITLALTGVTVAGDLVASTTIPGAAPATASGIHPTKYLNRYWTLTNSGITLASFDPKFTFVAGDIQGSAATSSFVGAKLTSSAWTNPTVGTLTSTSSQLTGVTSFGDFYLGEPGTPTVTSVSASSISTTGAVLNGTVNDNGSTTTPGFDYGTSTSYGSSGTASPASILSGAGATSVTSTIVSLSVNTQYNFRANATNSLGTTNGSNLTFYTLANVPGTPTVNNPTNTTLDVLIDVNSNPSNTQFAIQETGSGNYVQANGSLGVSAVWQTASVWGTKTVTGLSGGTVYAFQVKARNGDNTTTSFGTSANGTTTSSVAPTITSPTATAILSTTATLGGNVTSDGGAAITARGVVWSVTSLNNAPQLSGSNVTNVAGTVSTGVFTTAATSLPSASQISYSAYATNSQGTSYTTPTTFYTLGAEPTTQATAIVFSSQSASSLVVSWTNGNGGRRAVFMKAAAGNITNPSDANAYTASSDWNSKGTQLGTSGYYCIYDGTGSTVTVTNLAAATAYYVQVFDYNSDVTPTAATFNYYTATATGNPGNSITLSSDISAHAASFTAAAASTTSLSLSFSAASTITNAAGYIILQKSGNSAPTGTPTIATSYSVGNTIGDGTVAAIITNTATTSTTISGLAYASSYSFTLIPFNWNTVNTGTYNYYTAATIPSATGTTSTPTAPIISTPTSASVTTTTATLGGNVTSDGGDPVTARGIVWSETSLNADPVIGGSNVNPVLGTGTTGVYTVATTGLTSGVSISYKAYATNNYGTSYTTVGTFTTLAAEPITISSSMTFPTYTTSSVQVSFTSGNGANRIVVARLSATTRVAPTDANGYAVSSASFTDLSNVKTGTGNVVVYNGASNTVTVANLSAGTTYAFDVYEYNGSSASANYLTSSYLTGSKTTIFAEPTVQASGVNFTNVSSTSFTINWTKGSDATNSLVLIKDVTAVDGTPVDGTNYSANSAFSSGTQIGTGNYVLYRATLSTIAVTGLTDGHTYYVAIFAFNGNTSGQENYLTTAPATGSQLASIPTYYSQATGNPATLSNWNSIRTGGGSTPPDFTTTANFVIQNSHTMTTAATWSFGGSGSKLQIESGGNLTSDFAITIFGTATFQIDNGGTYIHNNSGAFGTTIFGGSESFNTTSNFEIRSYNTSTSSLPTITFGNFTINNTNDLGASLQFGSGVTTINGNFTLVSMGGTREIRLSSSTNLNLTVAGDLIIQGGILDLASSAGSSNSRIIYLGGNYNQTGGTLKSTGNSNASTINFTGSGKTFTRSAGTLTNTNINWTIADGASLTLIDDLPVATNRALTVGGGTSGILDCSTLAVTGAGAFTLSPGATLKTASSTGVAGSITVGGTKTFSSSANYEFKGAATGTFATTPNAYTVNNLTINRSAGVALSQNLTVAGTLALTSGKLAIGAYTLTLNGGLTCDATNSLISTATSNITLAGNAKTLYFDALNNTLKNLTITGSNTMTLGNALNITGGSSFGVVTVGSGATLATGGNLTLKSDANGTACIGNSAGSVSGNVTVERYVSSSGRRWRFLSSPVQSATVANWMTQFYVTGPGDSVPANRVNGSTLGTLNTNGWHTSLANINFPSSTMSSNPSSVKTTSIRTYNESVSGNNTNLNAGWENLSSTSQALIPGQGFRVFIRGAANNTGQLDGSVTSQSAVTLALTGTVNQGSITLNSGSTFPITNATQGWNLIGNPYPCAYNIAAHYTGNSNSLGANCSTLVYIYNPTAGTAGYAGYNANGGAASGTGLSAGIIPSGGAFFIKANVGSPTFTFQEAYKTTTTAPSGLHKTDVNDQFEIKYSKDSVESDYLTVKMYNGATLNYDAFDILKIRNDNLNLAAYGEDTMQVSASVIQPVVSETRIKLNVEATLIGTYTFDFKNMDNFQSNITVSLFDRYTNKTTDVRKNTKYTFDMGAGVNQWGKNRFELILNGKATTGINENTNSVSSTNLSVYPNPATDVLNISLSNGTTIETVNIYNVSGKLVNNTKLNGNQIDISQLNNGVYMVELLTANGSFKTKFVK